MNAKLILAMAAGIAAIGVNAVAASADNAASDQNLRFSRAYIERAYDMLSHDQADYGGHRVAAMNDIATARTDLTAALRYDNNPGDAVVPKTTLPQDVDLSNWERGQVASNENLEYARRYLERAIDMLKHDAHDYGGYRAKAVSALQAARAELAAAIKYRDMHGGGGHEPAGVSSDENIRYARFYVERAADMLQHDTHDYAGHRAAAVADILKAREDLASALRSDSNREDSMMPTRVMTGDEDLDSFFMRGQFASTENIEYVRRYVERAIDMLQKDTHDYHGYRVKAIEDLQAARHQLMLALQSR